MFLTLKPCLGPGTPTIRVLGISLKAFSRRQLQSVKSVERAFEQNRVP